MADVSRMSQPPEDWDRSDSSANASATSSSFFAFPSDGVDDTPIRDAISGRSMDGKRTLSDLLKIHAEKGTDVNFSPEEAAKLEEVLGRWINSGSSPYEGDDDFFVRALDDSSLPRRPSGFNTPLRQRGQSESNVKS